jgi:DNA-binding LytR/AlgR family response regulator
MVIRTYIIEDETPVRNILRRLLEQIDGVSIVGEAPDAFQALAEIPEKNPHLLFIDIQMPVLNGIELSRSLRQMSNRPLIVFATAYEEYAVEAFDLEAFDYLLKPFSVERLRRTIARAIRHLTDASADKENTAFREPDLSDTSGRLLLMKGGRFIPVPLHQIVYAIHEGGRVLVATSTDTYTTRLQLLDLEERLKRYHFIRTHRNSLVNINQILEVIPWFNRNYKLVMNDRQKTEIIVSRTQSKLIRSLFSL